MKVDIGFIQDDTLDPEKIRVGKNVERPIPGRNRIELTIFHHPDNDAIDMLSFATDEEVRTSELLSDHPNVYEDIFHTKDYSHEVAFITDHCSVDATTDTSLIVGCGPGLHSEYLSMCGLEVTGIDPSREMISKAQNRINSRFVVGGLPDLPIDSKFDLVWCPFGVINYVKPEYLENAVEELANSVAANGTLIIDCCAFPDMKRPNLQLVVSESGAYMIMYQYKKRSGGVVTQNWDIYYRNGLIVERETLYNHSFKRLKQIISSNGFRVNSYDWYGKPSTLPDTRLFISERA